MGRSPMQRGKVRTLVEVLVLLATVGGLRGQQLDGNLFKAMKWRLIGPFRGGRVLAVTGVPGEPNIYYFGPVSGGVWRTTNGGLTWTPLFDHDAVSSIGAIAVAASDPNVLYEGTGEACVRGNISHGDGVYKSTDGGKTWKNVGLKDTQTIARVIVNPHHPDVVLVAALGHVFGPNPERGVFRSTDDGRTWEKVLYTDDNTGAIDLTFDPSNPYVPFAALWEARLTLYNLSSGGPGSGLYKSSEAMIGNVGLPNEYRKRPLPKGADYGKMAWGEYFINPILGTVWVTTEDLLDRYVIGKEEQAQTNHALLRLSQTFLLPPRSFTNILRFKKPWYGEGARPPPMPVK